MVLEVGPGLGVLTRWLAERTRLVHAIEIDRRLEPALAITLDGAGQRAAAVRRRACASTSPRLEPPPTAMVANLPYAVATPVIMDALPRA